MRRGKIPETAPLPRLKFFQKPGQACTKYKFCKSKKAKTGTKYERPMPQEGPQTDFYEADADIIVYGGAAGGGKTYGLLLDPTKNIDNPKFNAVIFRRTMKQVKDAGGPWEQSTNIYAGGFYKAKPNLTERYWTFPSGATVRFGGLEHEFSVTDWQGTEINDLCFDELTHFLESQFWYMLSRNRSKSGVKPRVRASCNPAPGWVKRLLAPWVDKKFPNPASAGEVRYFVRNFGKLTWLDGKPQREPCKCQKKGCQNCFPPEKSITFIPSSVYDNKKLLEIDPGYVSNLLAQSEVERKRLHDGDWDAKPLHRVISSFDETLHVVEHREWPSEWRMRSVSMDFGKLNTAALYFVEDPDSGGVDEEGNPLPKNLYVTGEDWPGMELPYKTWAAMIRKGCSGTPQKGAGGNRTTEQGWRQAMRKEGIPMSEPVNLRPDVQYRCVNDEFSANRLFVSENCPILISMLSEFQHDLDDAGEPLDTFDDQKFHLCAALRYGIAEWRPPLYTSFDSAMQALRQQAQRAAE